MLTTIKVGELKRIISESANSEFNAKLGPNVTRDNKKNNEKSYKDSEKRAKDYDGGLKEPENKDLPAKEDYNRTLIDYNPVNEPDDNYKKRVNAQLKGYSSEMEEKNGIEKGDDYKKNEKIAKQFKDHAQKINDEEAKLAHSGLQAREFPESTFKKNNLCENVKPKAKKLTFKNTKFVNEQQVLVRIPEQYKVDGQIIHMCDNQDNVYIVECVKSQKTGAIETNIVSHTNKRLMNEQLNRINQLMAWNGSETNAKFNKSSENREFQDLMNLTRTK